MRRPRERIFSHFFHGHFVPSYGLIVPKHRHNVLLKLLFDTHDPRESETETFRTIMIQKAYGEQIT